MLFSKKYLLWPTLAFVLGLGVMAAGAGFRDGWYVGGLIGTGAVRQPAHSDKAIFIDGEPAAEDFGFNSRYTAWKVGLFTGYMFSPCGEDVRWRIAPELFIEAGGYHHNDNFEIDLTSIDEGVHGYSDRISMPWSFGLKGRFGAVVGCEQDWFLHGILGVAITPLEWQRRSEGYPFTEKKRNALGLILGLGVDKELCIGHRLGLELTYTHYGRQTFSSGDALDGSLNDYSTTLGVTSVNLRYTIPF